MSIELFPLLLAYSACYMIRNNNVQNRLLDNFPLIFEKHSVFLKKKFEKMKEKVLKETPSPNIFTNRKTP